FERLPSVRQDVLGLPLMCFLFTDTLLVFDNVAQTIRVVANAHVGDRDYKKAYADAVRRIDGISARLRTGRRPAPRKPAPRRPLAFTSNMSKADFEKMVVQTKHYIKAGDIFQGVLSQRWQAAIRARTFDIYRALRVINPSPYMYYLRFPEVELIVASPEVLVRGEDGVIQVRPIAGTRPRGRSEQEDKTLREELLGNAKERAEHVMLVDLGRNDVGRVAQPGSIQVKDFMAVEQYSHVMHLVSQIEGRLAEGRDAFDVLRACFPAGTVSGAPKIRAMEIIEELEPSRRGPYAGAVGYFATMPSRLTRSSSCNRTALSSRPVPAPRRKQAFPLKRSNGWPEKSRSSASAWGIEASERHLEARWSARSGLCTERPR